MLLNAREKKSKASFKVLKNLNFFLNKMPKKKNKKYSWREN